MVREVFEDFYHLFHKFVEQRPGLEHYLPGIFHWMLVKKGEIPYIYPVSRPNESQTSLYGDGTVNPKKIILRAISGY